MRGALCGVLLLALSGCLESYEPQGGGDQLAVERLLAPGWRLELHGCREGGGVSVYDREFFQQVGPSGWKVADIAAEVGNPQIGGSPFSPVLGDEVAGNWHMVVSCAQHVWNGDALGPLSFGWVAVAVEPPAWDTSGISRQFVMADLAFPPGPVRDAIGHDIHAGDAVQAVLEDAGGGAMHSMLEAIGHGLYMTDSPLMPHRSLDERTVRFWMLVPQGADGHSEGGHGAGGAPYLPVPVDLRDTGPIDHQVSPDNTAWFSHTMTENHNPLPGAAGNIVGVWYGGFDRVMTPGEVPNKTLSTNWVH